MARCCVLLADGFEEIEAITVIDVLRRAEVEVLALGIADMEPTGSHGIVVKADGLLANHKDKEFDLVVLPGGMPGATNLRDDVVVQAFLRRCHAEGRPLAAICAGPIALGSAGVLEGRRATCYPGFEQGLMGADPQQDRVVEDGGVTTSRGPGTALEFALALAEQLAGRTTADALRRGMLVAAD
jgi:4-methyl-5(b-hydroxyethyl)-thiazole monophosphate biosynthesis